MNITADQDFADLIARTLGHGVHVVELADALGVSHSLIVRWALNQNLPLWMMRFHVQMYLRYEWGIE